MILIKNGRVIDPKNKIDKKLDIAIKDDKIIKIGKIENEDEFEKILGLLETVNRAKPDQHVEAFLKGKGAEASA